MPTLHFKDIYTVEREVSLCRKIIWIQRMYHGKTSSNKAYPAFSHTPLEQNLMRRAVGYPVADDRHATVNSVVVTRLPSPKKGVFQQIFKKRKSCHLRLNILKNMALGTGSLISNFCYLSEDAVMFDFGSRNNFICMPGTFSTKSI